MSNSRINAIGLQLKGAVTAGAGKILGDAKMVADGVAEQAAGKAEAERARTEDPLLGIDPDRVDGIGHQLKGAVKQGFGKLVGDPAIEADGVAERASGKLQNAAGSVRDERRAAGDSDEHPAVDAETAAPPKP